MKYNLLKVVLFILLLSPTFLFAQANIGMATGNYAGVTGVWMNPASIADSRYKFDINIIGYDSYFENNYLLVKKDAFLRRLFYKDPYGSSYAATKRDLLEEQTNVTGNVRASVQSNIMLPLSFMATTGKKSAIAFTMNNRAVNRVDNMNPDLARMIFNGLGDVSLYGKDINIDSMQYNFLNWQEVGLTYSRVMLEDDHGMLKMGFTGKWLGANAGGYIQTDHAVVNFTDSETVSINSPLIHYARTEAADYGQFQRRDLFNNLEDQSFGWDFGFVYEFRGRVNKFNYIDNEKQSQKRRDLNKYTFRFGMSVVDMGKFTLKKKLLTNDHSASINGWDISQLQISNFTDWDSAYSQQVQYVKDAPSTFTYRLPSALIGNFDLHLFNGIYINIAGKAPINGVLSKTDTYVKSDRWAVITPRLEAKAFGLYLPVTRSHQRTNIGATVRIGPFYFGSNNLVELLTNKKTPEADFHFGFRISVPYGKPTKINAFLANLVSNPADSTYPISLNAQVDSLKIKVAKLEKSLNDSTGNRGVKIYIQNYGVESLIDGQSKDSIAIKNVTSKKFIQEQDSLNTSLNKQTDTLLYALAAKNLENEQLKEEIEKGDKDKNRKAQKVNFDNKAVKVKSSNDDLEKEVKRMRRQMAIQNATLITAVALANKDDKGDKKDSAKVVTPVKDSVNVVTSVNDTIKTSDTTLVNGQTIIRDSIVVRDTIVVRETIAIRDTIVLRETVVINGATKLNAATVPFSADTTFKFESITFSSGSYLVSAVDRKRLESLASQAKASPNLLLEITVINDATGSVTANRKIASARLSAVISILFKNGVKDSQILTRTQLATEANNQSAKSPRRVDIRVLKQN